MKGSDVYSNSFYNALYTLSVPLTSLTLTEVNEWLNTWLWPLSKFLYIYSISLCRAIYLYSGLPQRLSTKRIHLQCRRLGLDSCREDPLQKEMATYSSIPVWRIPWTEEPGGLQSMGSQRVKHDWATEQQQSSYIYSACHYLPWHISLCTYYRLPLSKYKCLMGSKLALLTAVSQWWKQT